MSETTPDSEQEMEYRSALLTNNVPEISGLNVAIMLITICIACASPTIYLMDSSVQVRMFNT